MKKFIIFFTKIHFRVTIPRVVQFPDIITRKLHNLRVTLTGNCQTKHKGNCWVFPIEFFSNSFWVWSPGGCAISGLLYPEIVQPPASATGKLHNLWVTIWGNFTTSGYSNPEIGMKKIFLRKYLRKNENIFQNILGCDSRA